MMGWSNQDGGGWSGGGGTSPGSFTTFDQINIGANIALSNGNLTATTVANTSTFTQARSLRSHSSGQFYVELTIGPAGVTFNALAAGIGTAAALSSSAIGSDAFQSIGFFNGGIAPQINSAGVGGTVPSYVNAGDVAQFAIDLGAQTIVFSVNGGTTTTVSISTLAAGPYFFYVSEDGLATPTVSTVNFGATPYAFTPPGGFGNW